MYSTRKNEQLSGYLVNNLNICQCNLPETRTAFKITIWKTEHLLRCLTWSLNSFQNSYLKGRIVVRIPTRKPDLLSFYPTWKPVTITENLNWCEDIYCTWRLTCCLSPAPVHVWYFVHGGWLLLYASIISRQTLLEIFFYLQNSNWINCTYNNIRSGGSYCVRWLRKLCTMCL